MSTLKIDFNTDDQNKFIHDTAKVQIDGNGATLKPTVLQTNEMLVATGRTQADADRAIDDNVATFLNGNASWDDVNKRYDLSNKVTLGNISLNDDSARDGVNPLAPTSHFNFQDTGCIRTKKTIPYSGVPTADNYFFSMGNSIINNGLGSRFDFQHSIATGNLSVIAFNSVGTSQVVKVFGAWMPVAGTEYEFELNINGSTAELYINGDLFGSISGLHTGLSRDYYNFGTDYTRTLRSEFYLRDIQIFDEIQHTENFVSEIPRILDGAFPSEALTEPQEFSTAEGFDDFEHDADTPGDSLINYVMKIENSKYWLNVGVLEISDGTFAQSNTIAEWLAEKEQVTTFISAGKRITMFPILYPGVLGNNNPTLRQTTTVYDFFAFPVSSTDCVLYGFVKDGLDNIVSGTARAYTKKPILTQGKVISFDETIDITPGTGFFEFDLAIPNLPVDPEVTVDFYYVDLKWLDDDGKSWEILKKKVLIPDAVSEVYNDARKNADAI